MKIILIAGKSGSGKTEAAKIIKEKTSKTVVSNFSKYIKLFATEMTDWQGEEKDKPRTFLQEMGDELRAIDEYFLPKRMLEDALIYEKYYDTLIVCDVRMLKEIEYMKNNSKYEVITILVESSDCQKDLDNTQKNHPTENEFLSYKDYDYIINNNYDKSFTEEIDKIIKEVF